MWHTLGAMSPTAHLQSICLFPWLFMSEVFIHVTVVSVNITLTEFKKKKKKVLQPIQRQRANFVTAILEPTLLLSWEHLFRGDFSPSVQPGFSLFCTWQEETGSWPQTHGNTSLWVSRWLCDTRHNLPCYIPRKQYPAPHYLVMNPSSTIDQLKEPEQVINLSVLQIPECPNPMSGLHSLPHSVCESSKWADMHHALHRMPT